MFHPCCEWSNLTNRYSGTLQTDCAIDMQIEGLARRLNDGQQEGTRLYLLHLLYEAPAVVRHLRCGAWMTGVVEPSDGDDHPMHSIAWHPCRLRVSRSSAQHAIAPQVA